MSQSSINLGDQTGYEYVQAVNSGLQAVATDFSGNTAPTTTYPFMKWRDTSVSPAIIRVRNSTNTAWAEEFSRIGVPSPINLNTTTQIKQYTNYVANENYVIGLYGGVVGTVKTEVLVEELPITQDDPLHTIITLANGSTGVMSIQTASVINFCRTRLANNISGAKLAISRALTSGERITIVTRGDSKTWGQDSSNPLTPPGIATDFGDGSYHVWGQIATPWPVQLQTNLRAVFGDCVDVYNGGYSGDRIGSSYIRQTNYKTNSQIDIFALGINDVLFQTANGATPVNIWSGSNWSIQTAVTAYTKTLIRSILRGAVPIALLPAAVNSLAGYDGTTQAVNKLLAHYKAAMRKVCEMLGVLCIDEQDSIGRFDFASVTQDGVHPNVAGAAQIAAQVAAAICWQAFGGVRKLCGPGVIETNPSISSVGWISGGVSGDITGVNQAYGFGRPYIAALNSYGIVVSNGSSHWFPVWLETDELHVMPIGVTNPNSGSYRIFTLESDFGVDNPYRRIGMKENVASGTREPTPPSSRNFNDATYAKGFHHESQFGGHVLIQGRGPHMVAIKVPTNSSGPTLVLEALKFGNFGEWLPITLLSGYTQEGDIEPALRVHDGVLEMRGIVRAAVTQPSSPGAMFIMPSLGVSLPTAESLTSVWNTCKLKYASNIMQWVTATNASDAVVNLADYRIPISSTVGV